MEAKKYPIRDWDKKVVSDTTLEEIVFAKVETGWVRSIRNLTYADETTTLTKIEVVVRTRGYDHLIERVTAPAAAAAVLRTEEIFLTEGEQLVVKFYGATASDVIVAYLSGYERKVVDMEITP